MSGRKPDPHPEWLEAERERRRRSLLVMLAALDVLEAATTAVSGDLAIEPTRRVVDRLDEEQLRSVLVAVAVQAVWQLPPAVVRPRTAGEIRVRIGQLRRWVMRLRLEAWLAGS